MMLADHHNRYDFSGWNTFVTVLIVSCVVVGVMMKRLLDEDEQA